VGLYANVPQSFSLVIPGGKPASTARLLASDSSGNLFIIYSSPGAVSANNIHIVKTDAAGNPLSSLDFGGSAVDTPFAAATDPQGNLIIVGWTGSQDFPLVSPVLNTGQAFATKIDSQLGKILFSTRLGTVGGGPVLPRASGVAVDGSGNIYITGSTGGGFPTTAGSLQPQAPALSQDGTIEHGFLMELTSSGDQVVFATYFSGAGITLLQPGQPLLRLPTAGESLSPRDLYDAVGHRRRQHRRDHHRGRHQFEHASRQQPVLFPAMQLHQFEFGGIYRPGRARRCKARLGNLCAA